LPRPRIHDFWIDHIRIFHASNRSSSAAEIRRHLLTIQAAPSPPPSGRAILRVMAEFSEIKPEEQQRYEYFHWPQSMQMGALPWESARIVLDLVFHRMKHGLAPPLVREAQWFYRVTLAIPDKSIEERFGFTLRLVAGGKEQANEPQERWIERVFAFQAWKPENQAAWEQLPELLRQDPGFRGVDAVSGHYTETGLRAMMELAPLPAPRIVTPGLGIETKPKPKGKHPYGRQRSTKR
jgi:hypothetical protein